MVSSARQAIAGIFMVFAIVSAQAQQATPEKTPSGSISGTVTIKGKAVAGIVVIATNTSALGWENLRYRATSDQLGNYSISKLPAGNYQIEPVMRSLIVETPLPMKSLLIADGENVENIDFALLRGGAITGRVTDAEGQPVIEERIHLEPMEGYGVSNEPVETDDRGVYRFFGLRPGKYRVAAGEATGGGLPGGGRRLYNQTFHPSTSEREKATFVEVKEGSETGNIDIEMSRPSTTFTVSGRVVDGETGKPLGMVQFGVQREGEQGAYSIQGGQPTNAAGEFKLNNLIPGKYSFFVFPGTNARSDFVAFEVIDHDIKDLIIKTTTGASVSGIVVLEGSEDKALRPKYAEILVFASTEEMMSGFHANPQVVAQDGTFKIAGLPTGKIRFQLFQPMRKPDSTNFQLVRVERNGMPHPEGIDLKDGENVTGLRLVVKEVNGKIRGVIKVQKGEPVFQYVSLSLVGAEGDPAKSVPTSLSSDQVDSRGRFLMEGIAPGNYVIYVQAMLVGGQLPLSAKQQVTVTNNTVVDVTITLEDKPEPDPF